MQDLLEALVLYHKGNRKYAYTDLEELSEDIKRNPIHMSERIMDAVRQDSLVYNLCPECFGQLESTKKIANIHKEKNESTICEYEYIDFCPYCGWIEYD